MQSDLLDAQAAVDWAKSNLPAFQQRIDAWFDANYTVTVRETPTDRAYDLIIIKVAGLPIEFSIEAGAYINTIRSSLDILACAIARREPEPFLEPDEIYFPVATCKGEWDSFNYKGAKFVRQLCGTARQILESHAPYQGGNHSLWAMHKLDVTRKHKRLLAIDPRSTRLTIDGWNNNAIPIPDIERADINVGEGETLFGGWAKGAPNPKFEFTPEIVFSEFGVLPGTKRVISLLEGFANCATAIIKSFDYP